jgi:mRNA interferase RelE/StbE
MKIWKVKLTEEAKEDFKQLDGSQKKLVLKQLLKLEQEPTTYGKPLGNKAGFDLTGYYKLYADKKAIRIIYTIDNEIVKVIAIDKRNDLKVYRIANERIKGE